MLLDGYDSCSLTRTLHVVDDGQVSCIFIYALCCGMGMFPALLQMIVVTSWVRFMSFHTCSMLRHGYVSWTFTHARSYGMNAKACLDLLM